MFIQPWKQSTFFHVTLSYAKNLSLFIFYLYHWQKNDFLHRTQKHWPHSSLHGDLVTTDKQIHGCLLEWAYSPSIHIDGGLIPCRQSDVEIYAGLKYVFLAFANRRSSSIRHSITEDPAGGRLRGSRWRGGSAFHSPPAE